MKGVRRGSPFRGTCAPASCPPPAPSGPAASGRCAEGGGPGSSQDLDRERRYFAHMRRDDAVSEHADAADLELDEVAVLHEAAELVAAAAAHGSRAQHLARIERLLERGVGD